MGRKLSLDFKYGGQGAADAADPGGRHWCFIQ